MLIQRLHAALRALPFLLLLLEAGPAVSADSTPAANGIHAYDLRCDYRSKPLNVAPEPPRLSWKLKADDPNETGQRQSAYQVLAARSPESLKSGKDRLWDSGKVASAEQVSIRYGGPALAPGERVYWQVRVWDRRGVPSPFSDPSWFEAALAPKDWTAAWITRDEPTPATDEAFYEERPNPLFRKAFILHKPIRKARVHVSGLGYYELRLNGKRVSDHVLDPGWTTYSKRVFYSTYDVTAQLKEGENVFGAMLGNGWYNPLPLRLFGRFNLREQLPVGAPRLILQAEIEYADGMRERVVTDETWRVGDGPILRNSVYLGETYDARREQPGWDSPGFDDSKWERPTPAREPVGPLEPQAVPPIRVKRILRPIRITEPKPGVYIFDMGQNFAGWTRLRVKGEAGTRVTLRYGELLHEDGTLNVMTSVTGQIKGGNGGPGAPPVAWQEDNYILKGEGTEEWTQRFTFHGFRYVEVTGFPGTPTLDALRGYLLHSDVDLAGTFSCSNPLFNRLQEVTRWTFLSNMFSVQSDCPHREKLGYGGDIVATAEAFIANFDMAHFYEKAVRDLADAARPNGGITETAPYVGIADEGFGGGSGPIGWGTAYPLLQWDLYRYYGNKALLAEQYDATKQWLRFLEENVKDLIVRVGISDHESIAPKPVALTGTAFYHYNALLMSKIAGALGKADDERHYAELAQKVKDAFNREFLQPGTGRYGTGTQASQAFALYFGLVPPEEERAALDLLVKDVMETNGGHLTTGIFGTKYLLNVLSDRGRADVAYAVADVRTYPGWAHMLERGATTLWEHWAFSDNTFSHNHPMFGSISEWFTQFLAGIRPDPDAVGYDRVRIEPETVEKLQWANGHYDSVRGRILSEWRRYGETIRFRIVLPVGVTGTVSLPGPEGYVLRQDGGSAEGDQGLNVIVYRGGKATFALPSGDYRFTLSPEAGDAPRGG